MEAVNPTKEPLKSDLLNGKWELIYTTSASILQAKVRPCSASCCFVVSFFRRVVSLSLSLKCKTETKVFEIDNKLPVYQCGYPQGSEHGDLAFLQLGKSFKPFCDHLH